MSTIVTRSGKGSALTHTEMDSNFTNLNNDKYQSGDDASLRTVTFTNLEKSNLNTDGQLGFDSSQGLLVYRTQQGTSGATTTVLDGWNVAAGTGITISNLGAGGTGTEEFTFALDYAGTDNFIDSATNLEGTAIATGDTIVYHDATDNNIKKGFVSDLPFNNYTHPSPSRTNNTSNASPAHGGTFTAIDSITTNSDGHVTAVNTKTVTLPSDNNTDTLQSIANDTSNSDRYITFVTNATGAQTGSSNANLRFNPSTGLLSATSKSFDIEHPTKEGMRLRYGSLEGPEQGVYVRGKLENNNVIVLPDYWTGLIDKNTITVSLTPIGGYNEIWVEKIENNKVYISATYKVNCFFHVFAERKDIDKLIVEYHGNPI